MPTVHNVWQLDMGEGWAYPKRPIDWGNQALWRYEMVSFVWPERGQTFRRFYHLWVDASLSHDEAMELCGDILATFWTPGEAPEVCCRSHLAPDDIWLAKWGKRPPVYWPRGEGGW